MRQTCIRKITPDIPVFSNISGFIKKLNQFQLTRNMDIVGWDNYPSPKDDAAFPALKHDIMRGLKDGSFLHGCRAVSKPTELAAI